MDDVIERAVMRVIEDIQVNFGEQITIDDMAHTAMFSKFHFSRVFQRVTGLSPGRFLSAVRLREAKRLLASTSLNIAYISHQVGYSSVGTFSSRFTRSVGLSPSRYRQVLSVPRRSVVGGASRSSGGGTATVHGTVTSPLPDRPVFAGMFAGQLLEGKPASYTVLNSPGPFVMDDVPAATGTCWPSRWPRTATTPSTCRPPPRSRCAWRAAGRSRSASTPAPSGPTSRCGP
ncbi:helix-turn-helix domain-containing protein [Nonomuraea thailandensis]